MAHAQAGVGAAAANMDNGDKGINSEVITLLPESECKQTRGHPVAKAINSRIPRFISNTSLSKHQISVWLPDCMGKVWIRPGRKLRLATRTGTKLAPSSEHTERAQGTSFESKKWANLSKFCVWTYVRIRLYLCFSFWILRVTHLELSVEAGTSKTNREYAYRFFLTYDNGAIWKWRTRCPKCK